MEQLNLESIKSLAHQPGVQEVFRFIVHYNDNRAYHSGSTLIYSSNTAFAELATTYLGFYNNRTIRRKIDLATFKKFTSVLRQLRFDRMYLPQDKLLHAPTIWYVERATGTFSHHLILSPHINTKPYCELINAIDGYLPDAVREILQ